jgi:hypothetical protein
MQTLYYSLMRIVLASLLLTSLAISVAAQDGDSSKTASATKPSPASANSFTDSHEGLRITVEPWTDSHRYKEKFPKKSPFDKGIVAIHITFRNDTDHGLRVGLQSIRLLVQVSEDNRQELGSLSPEDVADTVALKNNGKDPTARHIPIPIPVPSTGVKTGRDANWTAMRDACQNAGVPTSILAAHSTVEGLVYFDIRGELDLLQTAHMYFPNVMSMGDNQPLSYFDIPLSHDVSSE